MIHTLALAAADNSGWIGFHLGDLIRNILPLTLDGLTYGAIYALVALGYTLVYGVLNLINFAHSEVFISGAYAAVFTLVAFGFGPSAPTMNIAAVIACLVLAMVVAAATSGVIALGVERLAYKPLRARNAPRLVFLITAIGMSFVIQYAIFWWRGAVAEPRVTMFNDKSLFTVGRLTVYPSQIIIIVAAVLMMVGVDTLIRRTRIGRGIRAVAQDPDTATLMGVNRERVIMTTFVIGGCLAGVAAFFYIMKVPSGAVYNGGFILGIKAFTAAVLGGIGNVRGALLGGLLLGVIGNYGSYLLGSSQWIDIVCFVILVAVLMVRPDGILGSNLAKVRA